LLFGIHIARKAVSEGTPFVMVEGQLDAVRCWTEGFEQVVATQGTAITEVQLNKLKNYGPSLIMCLDGDAAGVKAAMRVLPMALASGIDIRFVQLDAGDDPDSLLRRQGRAAFQALLSGAMPVVPFLVERFFSPDDRDPASLSRACQHCFEIIVKSPSRVTQTQMVEELANLAGLDVRSLRSDFDGLQRRMRAGGGVNRAAGIPEPAGRAKEKLSTVESDLLRLVIQHAALRERLRNADPVEMLDPASVEGRLLIRICAELREDPHWTPERDADVVCETEVEQNLLYQLLASSSHEAEAEESFAVCLQSLLHRYQKRRLQLIERKLSKGSRFGDEELTALLLEKLELQRSIANQRSKR
jgi:DNA primase